MDLGFHIISDLTIIVYAELLVVKSASFFSFWLHQALFSVIGPGRAEGKCGTTWKEHRPAAVSPEVNTVHIPHDLSALLKKVFPCIISLY